MCVCIPICVCIYICVCVHTHASTICVHVFVSCVLYSVGNYVYISKPIRLAVNLYRANSNSDRRYLFKLHLCYSVFYGDFILVGCLIFSETQDIR